MRKYLILAALLAFCAITSACNTMEGLGQDIQKGGQSLEDAASKNK